MCEVSSIWERSPLEGIDVNVSVGWILRKNFGAWKFCIQGRKAELSRKLIRKMVALRET